MLWAIGGIILLWVISRGENTQPAETVVADYDPDDPGVDVDE